MSASMEGGEADPNMTPLLDVVLQLIMFFMITVNFVRTEHFPKEIILPVAQAAVPMDNSAEDWVYLNINKEGKLEGINEELGTQQKMKSYLSRQKEDLERKARVQGRTGELRIVVVVRAHQDARYSEIWEVLDSCQKAGYKRWQIRVMTGGPKRT
jgi:biopolymer transport protein ExbD